MARSQLLGVLFHLFLLRARCALLSGFDEGFIALIAASTVVAGDKLYVDGGFIYSIVENTLLSTPNNHTFVVDLTIAWNNKTVVATNIARTSLLGAFQSMFYSAANQVIYTFGGYLEKEPHSLQANPPLQYLNISQDSPVWAITEFQPPSPINSTTSSLTAASPGIFYSLGGEKFVKNGTGYMSTGLARLDMSDLLWSLVPSKTYSGYISGGRGLYLSGFGKQGIVVFIGGISPRSEVQPYRTNRNAPFVSMSQIHLFDIASGNFYVQTATSASGALPSVRGGFCAVAVQDSGSGGFDIFIYGGYSLGDETPRTVSVLSLPSFQWTELQGTATPHGRNYLSCEVAGKRQIVVVGGMTVDKTTSDILPDFWTDGLGIFDMGAMQWSDGYDPDAAPYQRAPLLAQNAQDKPQPNAWASPEVERLFNQTSFDAGTGTNVGAIAGGVVGGVAALAIIGLAVWYFLRRRRRQRSATDSDVAKAPDNKGQDDETLEVARESVNSHELPAEYRYSELQGSPVAHELPSPTAGAAAPFREAHQTGNLPEASEKWQRWG